MRKVMHLGLDDTDSTRAGCTTYVAALLIEKLEKLKTRFIDYPNLVRLNPNVPWKTRGNGALSLRFEFEEGLEDDIKKTAIGLVEEQSDLDFRGTDPGIVFFEGREVPEDLKRFSKKTETSVVTLGEAIRLVKKFRAEAFGIKTCRGIIGSLAAIGETLQSDHTYELIAYRKRENCGSRRRVDENSIFEMDRQTQPFTFNNVDLEKNRIVITPRGADPILLGIRGETPEIVKKAFEIVKSLEPVERWVIFRTNQGTDAHLTEVAALSKIRPHHSVIANGTISRSPFLVPVRHTIFAIKDSTAEVDCAAYEPTGKLRTVASYLIEGDRVLVYGAVRSPSKGKPLTINLEKINILSLVPKIGCRNPSCHICGGSSESMGRGQGLRCKKCGAKLGVVEKMKLVKERPIESKLYVTSTRSQRHLTKPLRRYGLEKGFKDWEKMTMIEHWHS